MGLCGLMWPKGAGRTVGCCEHGNEPSGFVKWGGGLSWVFEELPASQEDGAVCVA